MTMQPLTLAFPKGRILEELKPFIRAAGIVPEPDFFDESSRKLMFETDTPHIRLIRVRSFDVATFVAFGAAELGVVGSDVLMEFDYPDLYAPVDLGIGKCRLSVAAPVEHSMAGSSAANISHVRIATKYPNVTRRYFAECGVQAECVKLNGAVELAPKLGLASHIVDLVGTGATLKANGMQETAVIAEISSRLIVGRAAFKTRGREITPIIDRAEQVVYGAQV